MTPGAVVLGGSGSHAQVLAFSRTQAVNRILPAPRSVQAGVVREDSTGARPRPRVLTRGDQR
ncbi:hypothetical protein STRIP9103_07709 [Streptomyces ipomoeae 91-03]|uniref:Uncharacterized protein n=1 Tax=Streptomyces ipomoeae 91-03 TaxID=698759 RepID=L1KSZ5_9ACTN|nr:hypothetical protein STRIP9103_07709 [Streptomyces ipomoeae 91-03]